MVNDLLKDSMGKALETIPKIYDDGISPTVQECGKGLALIPRTVSAALAPLRIWIAKKEYNVAEVEKLLAIKLETVSTDSIVSPEAYIGVPAIQAISYCMDSEELRNLYANLLATSMIQDKRNNAHPSFIEVIKQLSSDEAKLLNKIATGGNEYPLIDVNLVDSDSSYEVKEKNFTLLADGVCDYPENVQEYIDNLSRLKIIDVLEDISLVNNEAYIPLENSDRIKSMVELPIKDKKWVIHRKLFVITKYGQRFIDTCVREVR